MYKEELCLTPIPHRLPPPKNSQIEVRCFTCKKFEVCKIKEDYLKTAQLISNILGAPAENYALEWIPGFIGDKVEKHEEYFPNEIICEENETKMHFKEARFIDCNTINIVYSFKRYYVLFKVKYNSETNTFDVQGEEVYYKLKYTPNAESLDLMLLGLELFREENEDVKMKRKEDIINVTAFSSRLECDYYEWEKGLTYDQGIKGIVSKYPHGIPLNKYGCLYHLATYHIEPNHIPCYHPENGFPVLVPMPYPAYVPPKCHHEKHYHTREQLNEF